MTKEELSNEIKKAYNRKIHKVGDLVYSFDNINKVGCKICVSKVTAIRLTVRDSDKKIIIDGYQVDNAEFARFFTTEIVFDNLHDCENFAKTFVSNFKILSEETPVEELREMLKIEECEYVEE